MAVLANVSEELAAIVADRGGSVVRVEARHRAPSSGVVWAADGVVLTADHAVEREEDIQIGVASGEVVSATLVGRDPTTDIAVLRAQAQRLVPAQWSDAGAAKVGHLVLALARPGKTVRARLGIISALGDAWRAPAGGEFDRYLETDVAMAFGFSGGLLLDATGNALGMNTAGLLRRTALAVPAATLRRVVEMLLAHGRVQRGYLGIGAHPVRLPGALRDQLGQRTGVIVISVEPKSPAEQAGIVLGDVLVAIAGAPVRHLDDVLSRLGPDSIGKPVVVKLVRGGEAKELSVSVSERTPG
ncbi:MAG TPA: trypsin-like peptidase domain-containing protein [bacterium]|jgi:S1-C subfamily serine protease